MIVFIGLACLAGLASVARPRGVPRRDTAHGGRPSPALPALPVGCRQIFWMVVSMNPFTVIYEELAVPGWQFFQCHADDADHAEEQCVDAYPTATVLWVECGAWPCITKRWIEHGQVHQLERSRQLQGRAHPAHPLEHEDLRSTPRARRASRWFISTPPGKIRTAVTCFCNRRSTRPSSRRSATGSTITSEGDPDQSGRRAG